MKHVLYLKHVCEGASLQSLQTFIDHLTQLDGQIAERDRPTPDTLYQ